MTSRQQSVESGSSNRLSFRLAPPVLPRISLRRIFSQSRTSASKSTDKSGGSWRKRFHDLTSANEEDKVEKQLANGTSLVSESRLLPSGRNNSVRLSNDTPALMRLVEFLNALFFYLVIL